MGSCSLSVQVRGGRCSCVTLEVLGASLQWLCIQHHLLVPIWGELCAEPKDLRTE